VHVVIRADASSSIGSGHVMRCLSLGGELRRRGASVEFVSRNHPGNLSPVLERAGVSCRLLPPGRIAAPAAGDPPHAAWVGASWSEDLGQTLQAMTTAPDWIVVDHYGLDARWESAARRTGAKIFAIDDLADRQHDCDLLLDQNLLPAGRYEDLVPATAGVLTGPAFALLHPDYEQLHREVSLRAGRPRRLFVFFGGADRQNLLARSLRAFLGLGRDDVEVDAVVGNTGNPPAEVLELAAGAPNIHLHSGLPTLAPLMAAADLAIGAGGASSWERLCLGLPSIIITLADNQRPIAKALDDAKLAISLGHQEEVKQEDIAAMLALLLDAELDPDWSARCHAAVDGRGAPRVADALTTDGSASLVARRATDRDELLLLEWANDMATRSNAFSSRRIDPAEHHQWLSSRLSSPDRCRIYILETEHGLPVGQARFDRCEDAWEIDFSVARLFRGRGLGARVLGAGIEAVRGDLGGALLLGRVKRENRASRRVFESLGFASDDGANVVVYRHEAKA
jgi:UDP-2,4-diacetamido-2,4,6-trideoxy-beta-L-altropyranose hydrolase